MVGSVFVVDPDLAVSHPFIARLTAGGCTCRHIASGAEAESAIDESLLGLIAVIDLPGDRSGWDIARAARRANPDVVIGYLGVTRYQDWLASGVPNSFIICDPPQDDPIVETVIRLCRKEHDVPGLPAGQHYPAFDWSNPSLSDRNILQLLFQKAPCFIAFLEGPAHRFTFANEAYLQVVDKNEVVGFTVADIFPEAVTQGFLDLLDRVYRTGATFHAPEVPFYVRTPNGIKHTLLDLMYYPVRAASGEITGIFVLGVDITEQHKAREQIKALQNELIHATRVNALGTLVSALAHEINQPLTSIHNYMAAAKVHAERQGIEGPIVQCITGTGQAALRAGNVMRRLREMATRRNLDRQPLLLEEAVRETIALASIGRFDCSVEMGEMTGARVMADRVQVQQVVLNLVQNALEAGEGMSPRVVISTVDRGDVIEVTVRDNGPGISDDVLPNIFQSFVTTKSQGMGVGLSISQTIIEAHGGIMKARNNDDGGASFSFTLPKQSPG